MASGGGTRSIFGLFVFKFAKILTIFLSVGNLPHMAGERDIADFFGQVGPVVGVRYVFVVYVSANFFAAL